MIKKKENAISILITLILFMALGGFWMALEIFIYGSVTSRVVDEIISIPIIISFYFNSRDIVRHFVVIK